MKERYTFGDNDAAADRLTLLARAFEPSSARLLDDVRGEGCQRAVDLGCGPGYTTALVHRTLGARETWGLDASDRLVARARAQLQGERARAQLQGERARAQLQGERARAQLQGERAREAGVIEFAVHDVTTAPFPVAEVDVFYARYLFTHLAAPQAVLHACARAASPGARMVIEDNCALTSGDPLFADYYRRVAVMHAHYGQNMFVGERLPEIVRESAWKVARFDRTRLDLDASVMARLHELNIRTWRLDPFAMATFEGAELDAMASALDDVANGTRAAPPVTCIMAQAIVQL